MALAGSSSDSSDDDVPLVLLKKKTTAGAGGAQDSDSSSSDDEPLWKPAPARSVARKAPPKKKTRPSGKKASSKKTSSLGAGRARKPTLYEAREATPLTNNGPPNRWWKDLSKGQYKKQKRKWKTLEHNGVVFPPPYEPHGIKMLYDGQPVDLTPAQEEVATFFAVLIESDHAKNKTFCKNFFKDWKKLLGKKHAIKHFELCDFSPIHSWYQEKKERIKEERKRNRQKLKEEKEKLLEVYGYALVDGFREKVGNFRVEPPGLFRGRGAHPKTGMLKRRVMPEQITLNIGKGVPIPKCPLEGHNWKGVIHDPNVTWLAYWIDNINGDFKYVFLSASSKFKGISDYLKYEKSRKLKNLIGSIRKDYQKKMLSKNSTTMQLATATYLIDILALRVGNEKDLDNTADTVGCLSVRYEHITFEGDNTIHFYFLGKDSMLYDEHKTLDPQAYKNIQKLHSKRKNGQMIFTITPSDLNEHLKNYMDGLSAKVFRTYNASFTLEKELDRMDADSAIEDHFSRKQVFYNAANKQVAILCNHQRSAPKSFQVQLDKLNAKLDEYKRQEGLLLDHMDDIGGKKKKKKAKAEKKESKQSENGLKVYKFPNDVAKCSKKLYKLRQTMQTLQSRITVKVENKTVALGTSKINYMDPRITVAWCKRKQCPIEKIFNASLLNKFPWAMEVSSDWRY